MVVWWFSFSLLLGLGFRLRVLHSDAGGDACFVALRSESDLAGRDARTMSRLFHVRQWHIKIRGTNILWISAKPPHKNATTSRSNDGPYWFGIEESQKPLLWLRLPFLSKVQSVDASGGMPCTPHLSYIERAILVFHPCFFFHLTFHCAWSHPQNSPYVSMIRLVSLILVSNTSVNILKLPR